ncbi:MAG: hypothetical protein RLZZ387_1673 [Chloroflexota bacterium]|jgi:hypothetical protein
MAASKTFYWFGISKLEVAAMPTSAGTNPTWTQVPSVESAALRASASEVKVYGDNALQYTFVHSPEMQMNVKLTKFSGPVAELITGNTAVSSASKESMYVMTNKDLNPPLLIARVTVPAKDNTTGVSRDLSLIFFRCSFRPIWDNFGSERGKATELNWVVDILSSTKTETGDPIPGTIDYAFGRYCKFQPSSRRFSSLKCGTASVYRHARSCSMTEALAVSCPRSRCFLTATPGSSAPCPQSAAAARSALGAPPSPALAGRSPA